MGRLVGDVGLWGCSRHLACWRAVAALLVIWVALFPVQPVAAAVSQPLFLSHLQMAQGLSHGDALAVLQDRQGFVWIATESGLNRYDGRGVRVYRRGEAGSEGLDADFINGMAEDVAGNLWLATVGGGLVRWDRKTDRFTAYRHEAEREDSVASDALLSVWIDPAGAIWVGTEAAGLDRMDPATGRFTHFGADNSRPDALPNGAVFVIAGAKQGFLWIGTDAGLALLDVAKGTVTRRYDLVSRPALPDARVRALHREPDGTLWVGMYGGGIARLSADGESLVSYLHAENRADSLSPGPVRALLRDAGGRLWVATAGGLDLMQGDGTFHHYRFRPEDPRGLPDSYVMSLYQDRSGMLWIGTRSGGVSRWNPRSWQMGHFRPSLAVGMPLAAFAAGNRPDEMLVGTVGAGLLSVDFRTGQERRYLDKASGLPDDRVMSLLRDRRGDLWIGTLAGGLVRQSARGTLEVFHATPNRPDGFPADGVMSLFEDRAGNIWVGTFGGGVCRYLGGQRFDCVSTNGPPETRLSDPRATALAEDSFGRIWIGTPGGGLNLFDPATRKVRVFRRSARGVERAGLSDDRIYSLHFDDGGVLWAGTAAGGLMRIIPPGAVQSGRDSTTPLSVRTYGVPEGLSSNVVYGIERGSGDELWLSTANGLTRFSTTRGVLDRFTEAQGLQGADFNFGAHHRFADGTLVFGGTGGLNRFRPSDIQPGRRAPPVVLTSFEIMNKPADTRVPAYLMNHAVLGYRDTVVSFEFAALDYVAPEDNHYEYQLEGFDEDWVAAGTRHRVSYTNLDAGEYTFRVRARNADGVASATNLALALQVQPAPWASPLAYAVYALLVLGLWAYALRAFHRKRRQEVEYNRRLEQTVQERTRELEQRNQTLQELTTARSAFVARMSHELRTPMNGVIGIADLLLDTPLDDTQRRFTRSIQQSAQSLVQIVSNILDFSKMEVAEIRLDPVPTAVDLVVEQAVELFAGKAAEKGLELICASPAVAVPEVLVDVVRFRQVVLNLIGNAVKFTDEGHVQVSLTAGVSGQDGLVHVVLRVEDTGIGIRPENLGHVFDAFQQEDNSTTRRFGGSGLGLTIARQLTELMGGKLQVTSTHGIGSVFTVQLSLPAAETGAGDCPSPEGLTGLREVFVLDQSPVVREVLLQWLGNWGVRARAVDSWAAIPLDRLHSADADDVFIGGEAAWMQTRGTPAEGWRDWPVERRPRCVLLSGFNRRTGTPPSGLNPAAFSAHLVKPLHWRELLQVLVRLADGGVPGPIDLNEPVVETATRTLQVLVVDDHALNRTIAVGKLAALGHHAVAVAGGQEALDLLQRQPFDLVLMDCQMPGMDGYQASAEIRRREAGTGARLPIVALTADATTESRERCAAAGMDDFIEKPFARETLAEQLAKWCPPRAAG